MVQSGCCCGCNSTLAVVFNQIFLVNDETSIVYSIKKTFQEVIAYRGMLETDMTDQDLLIPSETDECLDKPKVDVPYDIEEEKNTQKNVDEDTRHGGLIRYSLHKCLLA